MYDGIKRLLYNVKNSVLCSCMFTVLCFIAKKCSSYKCTLKYIYLVFNVIINNRCTKHKPDYEQFENWKDERLHFLKKHFLIFYNFIVKHAEHKETIVNNCVHMVQLRTWYNCVHGTTVYMVLCTCILY